MYTTKLKKWTKGPVLLLILTGFLSAGVGCAAGGLIIKTWLIDAERGTLVRRDKNQNITEEKSLRDANNYRCYSSTDDQAWRSAFAQAKACCESK